MKENPFKIQILGFCLDLGNNEKILGGGGGGGGGGESDERVMNFCYFWFLWKIG